MAPRHMADFVQASAYWSSSILRATLSYHNLIMPKLNALGKIPHSDIHTYHSPWFISWYFRRRASTEPLLNDEKMDQAEKATLIPYQKLAKKVQKDMENIDTNLPGVKHLRALVEERLKLHDEMINIPAFKAALYSVSLSGADDDFWSTNPESRHHAIIDMILNVRTAINRTRLLENRRFVDDNLRLLEHSCELAQRRKNRAKALAKLHTEIPELAERANDENIGDRDDPAALLKIEDLLAEKEAQEDYWIVGGKEIGTKSARTVIFRALPRRSH